MSTPSQGRSVTVTGLSGRVQALKFMQRGTASGAASSNTSTPSSPGAATSTPTKPVTNGQSTPVSERDSPFLTPPASIDRGNYGQEGEQWSLPPSKIAQLTANAKLKTSPRKSKATSAAKIDHEAGFESWLLNREHERESSHLTSGPQASTNTRQAFGSFKAAEAPLKTSATSESGKKRSRDLIEDQVGTEADLDEDETDEDDSESSTLEDSLQSTQRKGPSAKKNGFIKPGSLHRKSSKPSKQSSSSPSPSTKKPKSGRKQDQDRVVYTRKRGGKQGISGGRN